MTMRLGSDKFNDECGIFGIYGHPEAANLTYSVFMPYSTGGRRARALYRLTGCATFMKRQWDLSLTYFQAMY